MRASSIIAPLYLLLSASTAHAQPSSSSSVSSDSEVAMAEARVHFRRGVELYSEGNFDAALAELERAHQLSPTYKLLYNLAQIQVERQDYAAAIALFTRYLHEGEAAIPQERIATVAEDIARLRQRIAELAIEVDVRGAEVFVNEVSVGHSPLREPVLVNVGKCRVRVEKEGYMPVERTLSIAGADRRRMSLELTPRTTAAPPAPALTPRALATGTATTTNRTTTTPNMVPFWLSLGATVVMAGTTATFGGLAVSARQRNAEVLGAYPGRTGDLDAAHSRLKTFAALTDIFGAATIVVGVVGLYFLLSPPEQNRDSARDLGLHVDVSGAGATLRGTF